MPKRSSKLKDIVARSITLKDSKGKTRIFMGVLGKPAHSSICIFGEGNRFVEIAADPEGGVHATFSDGSGKIAAGLGIAPDNCVRLFLNDHRTELGSDSSRHGAHQISLYHRGELHWTTGKKVRRKTLGKLKK